MMASSLYVIQRSFGKIFFNGDIVYDGRRYIVYENWTKDINHAQTFTNKGKLARAIAKLNGVFIRRVSINLEEAV